MGPSYFIVAQNSTWVFRAHSNLLACEKLPLFVCVCFLFRCICIWYI